MAAFDAANEEYDRAWAEKNGAMIDYNFTKGEAALEYMKTCAQRCDEAKKRRDEAREALIARGGTVETYGDIDTDYYKALQRQQQ